MQGKRAAHMACSMLLCLAAAPVAAETAPVLGPADGPPAMPQMARPAPSGGVDVQVRVDDLVESYAASKNTFAFLIRDISFGYELSGTGRGAVGGQKFEQGRQDVDQQISSGKEPRGIIIEKGSGDQPVLRLRMAGGKGDILVPAKFIRSTWSILAEGRSVTIIAPVENLQILPITLRQIGGAVTTEVIGHLTGLPPGVGIEKLGLLTTRTDGDQVIIHGNKQGFTMSFPSVAATYSAELATAP